MQKPRITYRDKMWYVRAWFYEFGQYYYAWGPTIGEAWDDWLDLTREIK